MFWTAVVEVALFFFEDDLSFWTWAATRTVAVLR